MHAARWLVTLVALVLSTAVPASSAQRIHTVVSGQTLGGIAKRYGITVAELREANHLPQGVALKQGQRLLVPSPGEVAKNKRLLEQSGHGQDESTAAPTTTQPDAAEAVTVDENPPTARGSEPTPPSVGAPANAASTEPEPSPQTPAPPRSQPPVDDAEAPSADVAPSGESAPKSKPVRTAPRRSSAASDVSHRYHIVAAGHTIGKLANRYHVKIESICGANGISRRTGLKVGQKLVIPNGDDDPLITLGPEPSAAPDEASPRDATRRDPNELQQLSVPGAGPVYFYEPIGPNRHSMRPIVVYLHGRGGDAEADCRRWSRVARKFGWLLCPSGPSPHNSGRTWNNNWVSGQHAVMGSVQALRNLYGRRVQLYGNTLVGFSEGAYVAMNVGVRQPRTFNRWMILGADVSYWGGAGLEALKDAKSKVRRVALITGGRDQVVDDTRTVAGWLENEGVTLRVQTPGDLAHEVALDRKPELYVSALHWLDNGDGKGTKRVSQAKR